MKRIKYISPEKAARRGRMSKQKGASFERSICQRLSLWASGLKSKDVFWRSAMSGGRHTVASSRGSGAMVRGQAGDISAIHPRGHQLTNLFVIECKHLKSLEMHNVVFGLKGTFGEIWGVLLGVAKKCGRLPMLIALENRRNIIVVVDKIGFDVLARAGMSDIRLTPLVIFPSVPGRPRIIALRNLLTDVAYRKLGR